MKRAGGVIMCFLLAGCAQAGGKIQEAGAVVHNEGVKVDRTIRDWFDSRDVSGEPDRSPLPTQAYCYRTLGEISCYKYPVAGQQERLTGKQIPDPMFAVYDYPFPEQKPPVPPTPEEQEALNAVRVENVPAPVAVSVGSLQDSQYTAPVRNSRKSTAPRELRPLLSQ